MEWRELREKNERLLSEYAARSAKSKGRLREEDKCPIRTEYERDHNRILYSVDFRRLRHKTQVFFNAKNDHICTRMEHVLYVGAISQTIARSLNLNQDLAYAIALGHDLGHAPFGHTGERVLNKCVKKLDGRLGFKHELHSLRVVDRLASRRVSYDWGADAGADEMIQVGLLQGANDKTRPRKGLNLTFEVRDGIACHCGELYNEHKIVPEFGKRPEDLYGANVGRHSPATLEGCVVRIVDKIAYVGRDIEDAFRTGTINIGDISKDVLGELGFTNGQIINTLVTDLIENSYGNGFIALSPEKGGALECLIKENVRTIYKSERIAEYERAMSNAMEGLFNGLSYALQKGEDSLNRADERVFRIFSDYMGEQSYGPDDSPAQRILDFVAGMTDNFALQCYEELYWM